MDVGGVEAGGVEAGGVEAGGVEAGGVEAGGVDAGGVDPGGAGTNDDMVIVPVRGREPWRLRRVYWETRQGKWW